MNKCLVTTLKEAVTDNNLRKLGDMVFTLNRPDITCIYLGSIEDVTLTIVGNGHITDINGTANLGKTVTRNNDNTPIYLTPGNYDVVLSNKYAINKIDMRREKLGGPGYTPPIMDISEFVGMNNLSILRIDFTNCSGDMSSLSHLSLNEMRGNSVYGIYNTSITGEFIPGREMAILYINHLKNVHGSLANYKFTTGNNLLYIADNKISGNLSDLQGASTKELRLRELDGVSGNMGNLVSTLPNLETLDFYRLPNVTCNVSDLSSKNLTEVILGYNKSIQGPLSAFASMTNLRTLMLQGSDVYGDTSELAGCTNLTTVNFTNSPNITGKWPLT